jgi:hypothetical protein
VSDLLQNDEADTCVSKNINTLNWKQFPLVGKKPPTDLGEWEDFQLPGVEDKLRRCYQAN